MKLATVLNKALLTGMMAAALAGFTASAQAGGAGDRQGVCTLRLASLDAPPRNDMEATEKCYGVARTRLSSWAGNARAEEDGYGFLLVPKGLCEKLAGGSTTPKQ